MRQQEKQNTEEGNGGTKNSLREREEGGWHQTFLGGAETLTLEVGGREGGRWGTKTLSGTIENSWGKGGGRKDKKNMTGRSRDAENLAVGWGRERQQRD